MKTFILLLFLSISIPSFSQQNFINVTSSEATKKNKVFFQQQFNFNELIQSNTTIDLGLGKGFEIGVNVLGLNFKDNSKSFIENDTNDRDPYNPLVMLNGLKQFELSENLSFSVGGQVGANFIDSRVRNAALSYGNLLFKNLLLENSSLVIGCYYNSIHYGGAGNRVGGWIGLEIPIREKIHFVAESILGNNAISYTSWGVIFYPKKRIPITFGVQIPNTQTNAYALVFELTFVP